MPRSPRFVSLPINSAEDLLVEIRRNLFQYEGQEMKDLANSIGKSHGCLYTIRRGGTKWPRPDTLFPLMDAFGLSMRVRKEIILKAVMNS